MQAVQLGIMSDHKPAQQSQRADEDATERNLILRIGGGDRRAFEILLHQYGERVFRYAYRLINDTTKAEEVTNDVMLEVWKTATKFEGRSKVSTWLLGITRNLALNAVRRKQLDTVELDNAPEIAADEPSTPASEHDQRNLKNALRGALAQLKPEHRDVVELTFFHGCSYQQIAEIVECPENTVKTRMYHAKQQLKGILSATGIDPSSVELAS